MGKDPEEEKVDVISAFLPSLHKLSVVSNLLKEGERIFEEKDPTFLSGVSGIIKDIEDGILTVAEDLNRQINRPERKSVRDE